MKHKYEVIKYSVKKTGEAHFIVESFGLDTTTDVYCVFDIFVSEDDIYFQEAQWWIDDRKVTDPVEIDKLDDSLGGIIQDELNENLWESCLQDKYEAMSDFFYDSYRDRD